MQSLQVNILDVFHSIKHLPAEEKVRIMEHLLGVSQPPPSMPSSFVQQLPPSPPETVVDDDVHDDEDEIVIVKEEPVKQEPVHVQDPPAILPVVVEAVAKPKREINWWVNGYSFVIQRMKAMTPNHPAFKENYFNMDVAILLREKGYLRENLMPSDDQITEAFNTRCNDPVTIARCLASRAQKKEERAQKKQVRKQKKIKPTMDGDETEEE